MADGFTTPGDAFSIRIAPQTRLGRAAFAVTRPLLLSLVGWYRLRRLYQQADAAPGRTFESRVLHALGVRFRVDTAPGAYIPPTGSLIVAANHPTGALDGLILAQAVRQVRTDVRIVANDVLARIPELHESCFFVDPFGGPAAAARSRAGLRAAHLWLREGGALVIFPAGEVASRFTADLSNGELSTPIDATWHPTVGRLSLASGAMVLPAFIDARNSRLFYLAGRLHRMARTVMLGHQLLNKRGSSVRMVLGPPISSRNAIDSTPEAATESIRMAVDALARPASTPGRRPVAIEPAPDPSLLDKDIRGLPSEALLLKSGCYDVICARAHFLPNVLREIGRLREVTFRDVGEGTGLALDIDRFDELYDHLFAWNRVTREIVGAYRIGPTDRLLEQHGLNGLYTRTLFRYDDRMLNRLGPALELGRSFVRKEYQRSYSALFLLWKGIGELVVRSPQYRVFFGCVSISNRYRETSQQLLRAFLAREHLDTSLAELVEAVNPPSLIDSPARDAVAPADVDDLDRLITHIEGKHGMPVLLRQYLKLNATLLGFNVDPAFGDALDALMMVNLAQLPTATLQRYLGKAAATLIRSESKTAA